MSTKAKIGKDWVKCQLTLPGSGETLHLTFAPGEKSKRVVAYIDGNMETGYLNLVGLDNGLPCDATLTLSLTTKVSTVKAAAPVVKAASEPAPVVPLVAKPEPAVVVVEPVSEEVEVAEVQAPAVEQLASEFSSSSRGGRRKKYDSARDE